MTPAEPESSPSGAVPLKAKSVPMVIEGRHISALISNAHRLLGHHYRRTPLWALVSDLTGHGSTMSCRLCKEAGYDPCQPCGPEKLKEI